MIVQFKNVTIRNFLSIGDEPVMVTFQPGLHIITGINRDKEDRRNGVGKSSIADAIYFAIFGNTIRELKKEMIVNNLTRQNCEVILEFVTINGSTETHYKIIRSLEPSRCDFFVNGEDKTLDSITNTTELILRTLHTTPEVFENCVLMSINNTVPFMAKKKVEKRKFIESVFNLEVFSNMLSALKEDYNTARRDFDVATTRYDEIDKTLNQLKNQQQTFATEQRERLAKLNKRKQDNTAEIDQLRKKLVQQDSNVVANAKSAAAEHEKNVTTCDERISAAEKIINQNETTLNFKRQRYKTIGTKEDACPICLKQVTSSDHQHFETEKAKVLSEIQELEKQTTETQEKLAKLKDLRSKLKVAIKQQNDIVAKYNTAEQDNKNYKSRIDQLTTWNNEIDSELRVLATQTLQLKDDTKELNQRFESARAEVETTKKQVNILDTARFIISEEGVKSTIVKRMLQLFNSKLAYYLKKMDANCVCVFNEYFEEEIINEKGVVCSYFNFSGAERKSIDLACLFAFIDLQRLQGVSYNINLYDELFDSSVDEKGLELIITILRERVQKHNECIMVISHRKESVKAVTGEIICLEKQNGITRRVDYVEQET